jgi:hypothetical protein
MRVSDLSPLSPVLWREVIDVPNEFTVELYEVFDALSCVKVYKSPGPHDLPNWFLRDFAFVITEPVSHILNALISAGIMASPWKRVNVVPIPKVRPPKSIHDDLRPVSLTPTLSCWNCWSLESC